MRASHLAAVALVFRALLAPASSDAQDSGAGTATTQLRGFADVGFRSTSARRDAKPGFDLGQFDLYLTSRLADRLSFLAETVFEFDADASEFVVDVERVEVHYEFTDHLRLDAGKLHTPIGYWNNAYHHGRVIQPTIDRARLVQFEDDGGVLPVHQVGVEVKGRDLTRAHLGFDLLLGNGVGNRPEQDRRNAADAVTLAVHSQVTTALRIGASAYHDRLEAGSRTHDGADTLAASLTQTVLGAFVAYDGFRGEFIAEGHRLVDRFGGQSPVSSGWLAYAGVRATRLLVPYVAYDQLLVDGGDAYFGGGATRRGIVGLRLPFSARAVAKAEGRQVRAGSAARRAEFAAQMAVAF